MEYNFKDQNVLITGADGFIGSYLTKEFIKKGANVFALVHSKELKNLNDVKDKINLIYGDLNDKELINQVIDTDVNYIFHLAGFIKSDAYENPNEILSTNIIGTINIIEAAIRLKNLKRLVYFSTGEVYGNCDTAISENHEINPISIYATSKLASERVLQVYSLKKGLPITIIRLFNTYGPNKTDNSIFFFIKSALNNQDMIIKGNGAQVRSFLYIDDLVESCLLIGSSNDTINKIINIGGRDRIKIKDLAEKIKKLVNSSSKIVYLDTDPGLMSFYCDNLIMKKEQNWEPKIYIDEGLIKTINWAKTII